MNRQPLFVPLAVALMAGCLLVACAGADDPGTEAATGMHDADTSAAVLTGAPTDAADTSPAGRDMAPTSTTQLRASGNEPFWAVEVDGAVLTYMTPENQQGERWTVDHVVDAQAMRYSGEDAAGKPFVLEIADEPCADSMSGFAFPLTATLEYDGRTLRGCAEPANEM